MSLDFKFAPDDFGGFFRDETFRDTFTYRNSDPRRFPFPFDRDDYMYSVNMEPHTPGRKGTAFEHTFDVDEHYVAEMIDRAKVLAEDPLRCQSLPHMTLAGWDTLELIMETKARDYPQWFSLAKDGNRWHWVNRPLGIEQSFTFLDESTLPYPPFEYIMRQTQGDWTLQDDRDGTLWMDAGIATSQADWSVDFDVGMNFMEWHAPVPLAHEKGVFDRALKFLLKLQHGAPVRRFNWTMTVNPLLDTAPETYPKWGPSKTTITQENLGKKQHLRVELQSLYRLPRSNAIAFDIRCYLCSFEQIAEVPKWARRLHRVIRDLPVELATYKGFIRNRDAMVEWLSKYDDGTPPLPAGSRMTDRTGPLRLGFLMFPGFPMACLTSAIEPLRAANEISGRREFTWTLVSETAAPVRSSAEIGFDPDTTLAEAEGLDHLYLISPPTAAFTDPRRSPARLRWLDRTGVTLGAFSGGIFPLARAGLLDGKACSVHWCYEAAFKADFPSVAAREVTILREGRRTTASGAGAVFDLMLRLIEERLGRDCMTEVACWFQHPFVRDADASQKVPVARAGGTTDSLPAAIREAIRLFETHVEDPLRIPDVAAAVGLSGRHFERTFKRETGQSPLRYYHHLRLQKARQRVLYSNETLREIAASVGYMTSSPMIRHYTEFFGVSPRDERRLTQSVRRAPDRVEAAE